jgi:hemoglobin-like flavoprotein
MTPRQIELVQESWSRIARDSAHVAEVFYRNLFRLAPPLRAMFNTDMAQQRRALMQMLHIVVNGLYCFEELVPDFEALGRRHVTYGVVESQYELMRLAILGMLAEKLGDEFTPEVEAAWAATYDQLAEVMKRAANSLAEPEVIEVV